MRPYEKLERRFAKAVGTKHAVACNTGTAGLHLALRALGVGPGDEVIVPDFTMAACGFAVSYCGATPVFVDCEESLNMRMYDLATRVNARTKAIMVVHVYGRPTDMRWVKLIAKTFNTPIIEDCSEAFGARWNGQQVGTFGDIGVFSLYQNKIVAAQEGGICVTNSAKLRDRMSYLKNMAFGKRHDYFHEDIGYNYRMSDAQAELALASLADAPKNIAKRLQLVKWYDELLGAGYMRPRKRHRDDAQWVYDVLLRNKTQVEAVIRAVPQARRFFQPLSTMPPWRDNMRPSGFNAAEVCKRGVYLPLTPTLTKADVTKICRKILKT